MTVSIKLLLTIFITVAGASFQFYSFAVLNTPQEIIEQWMSDAYRRRNGKGLDSGTLTLLWSFTVGSISIGAFVGSLLTRSMAETCGRRNGLIANAILNVFGGAISAMSKGLKSPEFLILGRFILGINMGLSSGLAPMYLTEIAPVEYRGAAGTSHMISVAFGDWFSLFLSLPAVFGSEQLWPIAVAFPAIFALALAVLLPFSPESPRYLLISMGDREKARNAIRFFEPDQKKADDTFEELVREAAISPTKRPKLKNLFTRKELRTPLMISILVMIAQQFTGAAAIFAYSSSIFQQANLDIETARYCTLGVGICYFIFTLPSPYLIEKIGRRRLSLIQLTGCLICLILLSLFIGLQQAYGYIWASYGSIGAMILFMCVYGVGSPIPWMITSEVSLGNAALFQQQYRSSAVSITTFVAWFFAFIISTGYLPFSEAVGTAWSFLPFIIVLSLSIIGMALLLPETKNKTIEEIVQEFKGRARTLSRAATYIPRRMTTRAEMAPLIEEEDDDDETPDFHSDYGATDAKKDRKKMY